ncbi:hypothetical protein BGZ76_006391, partial [Entomortierella beljakovae]
MPNSLVVVGCMALGAVTLPISVPLIVASAGFGSGGIVAGTTAAWYMSTYGGVVASGSSLAVLQSIGAVGLGATANVATAGVGALIGWASTA